MSSKESSPRLQPLGTSPRGPARAGGVLYVIIIVLGLFDEVFVRSRILLPGDAAATAMNLSSMEQLWRLGIAARFVMLICAVAVTLILLILLRPVSHDLARLAVFFNLVAISIEAVITIHLLQALFPLGSAEYLQAFQPEQRHALARLAIRSHGTGFGISLLFFGCVCLLVGYLILRSGYFPRVIGILMLLAGASYLINSFALILAPALAARLFPAILIPAFVGEVSFSLWLLLKGVDLERWKLLTTDRGTHPAGPAWS